MNENETAVVLSGPRWMMDTKMLSRIFGVYEEYTKHRRVEEIAEQYSISVPAVYLDVRRARQFMRDRFAEQLMDAIMEQVDAHKNTVRELYSELDKMKLVKASAKRATVITKLMHEIGIQEKMIEELLGLRDRRGKPVGGKDDGWIESDDMIVVNEDGTIEEGPNRSIT